MTTVSHEKKIAGMIANLQGKTGKTLSQWIRTLDKLAAETDAERTSWLEKEHGLGHFQSRLIVREARKKAGRRTSRST